MSGTQYKMFAPGASSYSLRAPGSSGYTRVVLPGANRPEPPHHAEHVVEPGTRQEMIDGVVIEAQPANAPHAQRQAGVDYVLQAHVADGYVAASDLLTRTSTDWNFAADASIRKDGADPADGKRYLEELAFEIKASQSGPNITSRARELSRRGVRRVFGIWVNGDADGLEIENGPVKEWSAERDAWIEFAADDSIEDPCLRRPLEIKALLDAAAADDAVAAALLDKGNPVLSEHEKERFEAGKREGVAQELRRSISDMCEMLGIDVHQKQAEIAAMDIDGLRALRAHLKRFRCWRPVSAHDPAGDPVLKS